MCCVAIAQMNSSSNVEKNLASMQSIVEQAADQKARMIILPENFAFMGPTQNAMLSVAELEGTGVIQDCLRSSAMQYGLWIVAGSLPLISEKSDKIYSASMVYNDKGELCARYNKMHLFDVLINDKEFYKESDTFLPGTSLITVDSPVGRLGLSVCYDLRFAELYRGLVNKGAEVLLIPSAFTAATGKAHWEALLRARAIENLCYVLAPNQCGVHSSGRETWGHSMAVNPWGMVMAEKINGAGIITVEIDLEHQAQIRQRFPCNAHHILD